MFPLSFGGVVHVFRACLRCQSKAAETTATNYRFSEIMEHERATSAPLPAWARTAPWWAKWWAGCGDIPGVLVTELSLG